MIQYIILALASGIFAGTITGLVPGLHVNLIAVFLVSISTLFLAKFSPIILLTFVVALSICHTFLNFIPAIFLGAPDEDTSLSILPGHEMLNKGRGYEAIIYTLYGSCLGLAIIFIFTPLFIFILPLAYKYIKTAMFFILILASIYLITKERKSKILALLIFFLAGFLGIASLNFNISQPILPLLTGLFGASSLMISLLKKKKIPKQKINILKKIKITRKKLRNSGIAAILSAPLCTFLPSLGSSQAAVIGSDIIGETDRKQFLILLGSINTIVAGLAFITLYSIQKTRTGAAVAINKILEPLTSINLFLILAVILFSGIAAFFLTIYIGKFFAKKISRFNYRYLSLSVLIFLVLLSLYFSGFLGFLIFIVAATTGLTAILLGIRRTHLMGSLMIPTILIYLPF
jgi:putative membrane protein